MKVGTKDTRIGLTDVNAYITCVLCKGYLVDATTITECLHTFCKKCIVEYLEENTNCPICDCMLHQSHPLLYISHDRTLQAIVYKLVPNLEKNELENQIKYYKESNLEYPPALKERLEGKYSYLIDDENKTKANSSCLATSSSGSTTTTTTTTNGDSTYHRFDEQIALCLEPLDGLKVLDRKYILCSCHMTITHVKKYVAKEIYKDLNRYKDIDIVFNEEILGKDHTLKFVLVTKWKDKDMPMRLNFRPKLVF